MCTLKPATKRSAPLASARLFMFVMLFATSAVLMPNCVEALRLSRAPLGPKLSDLPHDVLDLIEKRLAPPPIARAKLAQVSPSFRNMGDVLSGAEGERMLGWKSLSRISRKTSRS